MSNVPAITITGDIVIPLAEANIEFNKKVDKVSGKGLTENELTNELKTSYDSAALNSHNHTNKSALDLVSGTNTGDETQSSIITKLGYTPVNPEEFNDLKTVAFTGSYNDLTDTPSALSSSDIAGITGINNVSMNVRYKMWQFAGIDNQVNMNQTNLFGSSINLGVYVSGQYGNAMVKTYNNYLYQYSGYGQIFKSDLTTGATTVVAGTYNSFPASTSATDGDHASNPLAAKIQVMDFVLDTATNILYFIELYRIRQINFNTGEVKTLAGMDSGNVIGAGVVSGTTTAKFNTLKALVKIGTKLYVLDSGGHCIKMLDTSLSPSNANYVTRPVGDVFGNLGTTDGTGNTAKFNSPWSMCSNTAGTRLYVSCWGQTNAIRVVNLSTLAVFSLSYNSYNNITPAIEFNQTDNSLILFCFDGVFRKMAVADTATSVDAIAIASGGWGYTDGYGTAAFAGVNSASGGPQKYKVYLDQSTGYLYFLEGRTIIRILDLKNSYTVKRIGVNTTNPNYDFDVKGQFNADMVRSAQVVVSSDERWKKDIEDITDFSAIDKLQPKSYFMNGETSQKNYGFIAQELEKVLPDLIHYDEAGYRSVYYLDLIAPMVGYMKNLSQRVAELEKAVLVENLTPPRKNKVKK